MSSEEQAEAFIADHERNANSAMQYTRLAYTELSSVPFSESLRDSGLSFDAFLESRVGRFTNTLSIEPTVLQEVLDTTRSSVTATLESTEAALWRSINDNNHDIRSKHEQINSTYSLCPGTKNVMKCGLDYELFNELHSISPNIIFGFQPEIYRQASTLVEHAASSKAIGKLMLMSLDNSLWKVVSGTHRPETASQLIGEYASSPQARTALKVAYDGILWSKVKRFTYALSDIQECISSTTMAQIMFNQLQGGNESVEQHKPIDDVDALITLLRPSVVDISSYDATPKADVMACITAVREMRLANRTITDREIYLDFRKKIEVEGDNDPQIVSHLQILSLLFNEDVPKKDSKLPF